MYASVTELTKRLIYDKSVIIYFFSLVLNLKLMDCLTLAFKLRLSYAQNL